MIEQLKLKIKSAVPDDWDVILVFLVLALALRIYFAVAFEVIPDSMEMTQMNRYAAVGHFDKFLPPLYVLFLRIVYRVFGYQNYQAAYLIQGIISALIVVPMYVITSKLGNRKAGLIAAALSAVYPNFILYNLETLPDSFCVVLVVLLMYTAVTVHHETRRSIYTAVLTGLGILTKPIFWFLVPGTLITIRKRLTYLAIIATMMIPWVVYSSVHARKFVPGYHPWSYQLDISKYTDGKTGWHAVQKIYINASTALKKFKVLENWEKTEKQSTYAVTYAYIVIMLLGFGGMIRYYDRKHRAVILPVLLYALALILFSRMKIRYRSLLEPVLIIYTSILSGNLCERLIFRKSAKPALPRGNS